MASSSSSFRALVPCSRSVSLRSFSSTASSQSNLSGKLMTDLASPADGSATTRSAKARADAMDMNKITRRLDTMNQRSSRFGHRDAEQNLLEFTRLKELSRTAKRDWKMGDVYAPHDLSAQEAKKWRKNITPSTDIFDQLAINPLDEWKNPALMHEFQSRVGRISKRDDTGLRPVNQRRVARAIRRGVGMGFLPSVHAHPEILRRKNHTSFRRRT